MVGLQEFQEFKGINKVFWLSTSGPEHSKLRKTCNKYDYFSTCFHLQCRAVLYGHCRYTICRLKCFLCVSCQTKKSGFNLYQDPSSSCTPGGLGTRDLTVKNVKCSRQHCSLLQTKHASFWRVPRERGTRSKGRPCREYISLHCKLRTTMAVI